MSEYVNAHTDFRFQSVNKNGKCPYCHKKLNIICRKIWQGPINKYFHAIAELVCSNPECPFPSLKSWDYDENKVKILLRRDNNE